MSFSSLSFLYLFLPPLLLLYYPLRSPRLQNALLLAFSLFFFAWGAPRALPLLLGTALLVWLCGLGMAKGTRVCFPLALGFLIGSLGVFKYLGFFGGIVEALTGVGLRLPQLLLPAGISFYTFQLLAWLFDLRRGEIDFEPNFFRFLLFVCFFPQLLQGPILRYKPMEAQLIRRTVCFDDAVYGMRRFLLGLAKKVLIADQIAMIADQIYAAPTLAGTGALWLAGVSYTLQLYFDFSGYSDMAVGLGRIFGFTLPENFDYPYAASSVTDFWRRWHITLSRWFRDYVYIPLGGSRVGRAKLVRNILIVWALTGLWHGASWNFVLWGLYYGVLLLLEKLLLGERIGRVPMLIRRIVTLALVTLGWVLFKLTDAGTLLHALRGMFVYAPTDWHGLLALDASVCSHLLFLPPAVFFSFPLAKKLHVPERGVFSTLAVNGFYVGLLVLCTLFLISASFTPFLYFNF